MVDLDSNPTKLIEVVETGKQMLMTRGSLTTFSIANDVAKYFAIIPAAFATTYPKLDALNVMHLASPVFGDSRGGDLQCADHHLSDSAGVAGVSNTARLELRSCCAVTCWFTGWAAFSCVRRNQAHRSGTHTGSPDLRLAVMRSLIRPALVLFAFFTVLTGLIYPLAITGIAQAAFSHAAAGTLVSRQGAPIGSTLIGPEFQRPEVLLGTPVRHLAPAIRRHGLRWLKSGSAESRRCSMGSKAGSRPCRAVDPGKRRADPGGSGDRLGQWTGSGRKPRRRVVSGGARRPRARPRCRNHPFPHRQSFGESLAGRFWGAAGQRAAAEPGAG